jgi:hypothetical protein
MSGCWQWVFLPMFIIPIVCVIVIFIATLSQPSLIKNGWFFLLCCLHYICLGLLSFSKAASIGSKNSGIPTGLYSLEAEGKLSYHNPLPQVEAYKKYLTECSSSFSVFGVSITETLIKSVVAALSIIFGTLSDHVVH